MEPTKQYTYEKIIKAINIKTNQEIIKKEEYLKTNIEYIQLLL